MEYRKIGKTGMSASVIGLGGEHLITVMKTLGGGRLLSAEHFPFKKAMSVTQCIHYALTRPGVVSTLIGCQSAKGADCIACGSCEEKCPFSVPIIENMERATRLLG